MICGGCQHKLEPGDKYIEDTPSGYIGSDGDPAIDSLLVDILTGNDRLDGSSDRLIYCEACTYLSSDGRYQLEVFVGEDA